LIETSDVLKIKTDDPVEYPLPSYDIFEVAYALQPLVGGLRAAGFLKLVSRSQIWRWNTSVMRP
jgi:hypothetical protein